MSIFYGHGQFMSETCSTCAMLTSYRHGHKFCVKRNQRTHVYILKTRSVSLGMRHDQHASYLPLIYTIG